MVKHFLKGFVLEGYGPIGKPQKMYFGTMETGKAIAGRGHANDIDMKFLSNGFEDKTISKDHFLLTWEPKYNRVTIKDLDSLNGTKVNGYPVSRMELHDRDLIMVGRSRVVFRKVYKTH